MGFRETIIYQEYNLSHNPVGILSFDNIFLECDIAHGMTFRSKRSGVVLSFTMDVNPGFKYFEFFRGGKQWFMVKSKDVISSIFFNLKNENGHLISFSGQSVTFRLPIKEI